MTEKLSIHVNVAGRIYPLKIDRKEEEKIRKAAKTINETMVKYKQLFRDKDDLDFLAMTALQLVTRKIENEGKEEFDLVINDIKDLSTEIDTFIKANT